MRVLIVNTSECKGGAAIAAHRLTEALINNGVKAKMLVMEKQTDALYVADHHRWVRDELNFVWERFVIWVNNLFSRRNLWPTQVLISPGHGSFRRPTSFIFIGLIRDFSH